MEYPKALIDLVLARSEGFQLEGFVAGQGPIHPKLMIVGEAPGKTEIVNHIPFSGQAGKELSASLTLAGLTREETYITSAVRSRPFSIKQVIDKRTGELVRKTPNRTPTKKEVLAHAPILDWEMQVIQSKLIATVGNIGLHRLLGPAFTVSKNHGQLIEQPILQLNDQLNGYQWSQEPYRVVPLFHPAAVFYNRKLQPLIEADWQAVKEILTET